MKKNAHNAIDRTGQVYSYWTILYYSHTDKYKKRHYKCKCLCGKEKIANIKPIVTGKSKSCGCLNTKNHIKHGMSNSRVYNIWQNIKNRTLNPKSTQWKWYGGRGIKMCIEWQNSFIQFYLDMGDPPSKKHSIDRVNNNGNYDKSNCKWSTPKEQSNNRRTNLPKPPSNE